MTDYYQTLGINRQASASEIKKAYKKMAMKYHPDRNPSPEASDIFINISEAYQVLSDPAKKQEYDAYGSYSNPPSTPEPEVNIEYEFYRQAFEKFQEEQEKIDEENKTYNSKYTKITVGVAIIIAGIVIILSIIFYPSHKDYYKYARSSFRNGVMLDAHKEINRAIELAPNNPTYLLLKARILVDINNHPGKTMEVVIAATNLAEEEIVKAECMFVAGMVYFKAREFDQAKTFLLQAKTKGYDNIEVYTYLGKTCFELSEKEEAQKYFDIAQEMLDQSNY